MNNDTPAELAMLARFNMIFWHYRIKKHVHDLRSCQSESEREFVTGSMHRYAHLSRLEDKFLRGEN